MPPRTGINLLPKDQATTPGLRFVKKGTLGAVILYIIVMLSLFGYLFFLNQQKKTLTQKNDSFKKQILSLKDKEGKLFIVKDRVLLSKQTFINTQAAPHEMINNVLNVLPSDVQFTKIEARENGEITLVAQASNSKSISQFFTVLKEKKYANIYLNTFVLTEDEGYLFSLDLK